MGKRVILAAKWFSVVALSGSGLVLLPQIVAAQIAPDDTLGVERSVVNSNTTINGELGDRIEGGARRGANLFHSFQEFNVNDGQRVYFSNPDGIENILSRVTGSDVSDILGTLGVAGDANLFLLNPNGIIFGANAQLDIRGSFVATTADAVQFGDQGFFSAANPEALPLLTVNPSAFLFNQLQRGDITNRSIAPAGVDPVGQPASGLRVSDGATLTLLGGNVNLEGGRLNALGGRAEIGAVAGTGTIALNPDSSLGFPDTVGRSDVSLTNGAAVNAAAGGGGDIAINARNINLSEGSTITTGILPGLGGEGARSGDIQLNATNSIQVRGGSQITTSISGQGTAGDIVANAGNRILFEGTGRGSLNNRVISRVALSRVEQEATGEGGDIRISANSVVIKNGAGVSASNLGQGDAGNIIIYAVDTVSLDESVISSNILGTGQGGDIQISARVFSGNGAQLGSAILGEGRGGDVTIRVDDRFSFRGTGLLIYDDEQLGRDSIRVFSGIYSLVEKGALGQGGNIHISARSISIINGVALDTGLRGQGSTGNIRLHAGERLLLDEGFVSSAIQLEAIGNAGSIQISTRALSVLNGSALTSSTYGRGRAGNIIIHAHDSFLLEGVGSRGFSSVISTNSFPSARGRGGNIEINTSRFQVVDGAIVSASTDNANRGGNITINSDTFIAVNGGQITTTARGNGRTGNINLNITDQAILSGQDSTFRRRFTRFRDNVSNANNGESGLFASTYPDSTSDGGNIVISAPSVTIQDGASIAVDSQGSGEGGNVYIETVNFLLDNQALISAATTNNNGGDVSLRVSDILLLRDRSNITTEAGTDRAGGNGGNIDIDAGFVVAFPAEDSNINANAFRGNGGTIDITAQSVLGLQVSEQPTFRSDITASSQLGVTGEVNLTTPDLDPNQGLVELPAEVVDASQQIAQSCSNEASATLSEFTITGRGGLPSNPTQALASETVITRLAELDTVEDSRQESIDRDEEQAQPGTREASSFELQPIEAQGWVVDAEGNVALVARSPMVTPHSPALSPLNCDRLYGNHQDD
ncbi:MAG: hypothetical protein Kow00121_59850 [Elainellaceae cyanobacterium]